jgi:hypothetical protein
VSELQSTTRCQRSQDCRLPDTLWQAGASEPAATVSMPARRTVISKPAGRVAVGAQRARATVSGEQVVVVGLLRSDGEGLAGLLADGCQAEHHISTEERATCGPTLRA